jgi:copper chaperone CopZ
MKKLLMLIMIGFLANSAQSQFSKASLQATGLTCAMCSNAINKALQAVPFVESVRSDIKNSAFNIVFRADNEVSIDALKEAVEDAGFSVGSLKVTGNFQEMKIEKDKHIQIGNEYFHFLNSGNQTLNGETTFKIVDKSFVTDKEFKKVSGLSKKGCLQTGKSAECCTKEGVPTETRIYHVTI